MAGFRPVQLILMKRKDINLTREDRFGHWWFEIGAASEPSSESYGWWPKWPVDVRETFVGIEGELNGRSYFGGTALRDVHHGDEADQQFHPLVRGEDSRSDEEIAQCLRDFARSFRGEWRWTFGKGQNCHSFQEDALRHCGLKKPGSKTSF
jgi:hypothetical protein